MQYIFYFQIFCKKYFNEFARYKIFYRNISDEVFMTEFLILFTTNKISTFFTLNTQKPYSYGVILVKFKGFLSCACCQSRSNEIRVINVFYFSLLRLFYINKSIYP